MPTAWKDLPELAGNVGAGGDALAVLLDSGLLQAVEIADQVVPFDVDRRVYWMPIGALNCFDPT